MAASKIKRAAPAAEQKSRRDFIVVATYAMGAVGAGAFAALIDQMNPAADTPASASIEVDVSKIAEGQSITLKWRGKPVFIRHRTASEIDEASRRRRWICVIRKWMVTRSPKARIFSGIGRMYYPLRAAWPEGGKRCVVNMTAGFAPAMARIMSSGRIRKGPATNHLKCCLIHSCQMT